MTLQEFYKTGKFVPDHTKFGGLVTITDFDGCLTIDDPNGFHSLTKEAQRIVSYWRFDESCKKTTQNKERMKLCKKERNVNDNK